MSIQRFVHATVCPCNIWSLRRFVHNDLSTTIFPQRFVREDTSTTYCPATNCPATKCPCNHLFATICPRQFVFRRKVLVPLKHPIIPSLIQYYSTAQLNDDDNGLPFLNSLIENIILNLSRSKNSYRYNKPVNKFSVTLYILAGRNAYEFMRLNISGTFPSVSTIQSFLDEEERNIKKGEFRFDIVRHHLTSTNTHIAFCSEDCTAIIPKVTHDINSNSFVGFSLLLVEGCPITDYYRTDSLTQLENWCRSGDKSTLLNIHMIQPIVSTSQTSSPIILSSYGTNCKYTSLEIIRRWIWIFDECLAQGIRIIGFPTDAGPKYLKAMKLL